MQRPGAAGATLAGETVLRELAGRAGDRAWRVAFHPYPKDLRNPAVGPDYYPYVTYGNIGVLAGWLRADFRDRPAAWDIQLTESGLNSLPPSTPQRQAQAVCDSFRNVLGTPGISNYGSPPTPAAKGCHPLGQVGYISTQPAPGTVRIYRCIIPGNGDHFISARADCEGQRTEKTPRLRAIGK